MTDHPMDTTIRRLRKLKASHAEAYAAGYRQGLNDRARQRPVPYGESGKGPKPYGYWPDEARTLAELSRLTGEGLDPDAVAKRLNKAGHRTRSESTWTASAVAAVLESGRHGPHD